MSLPAEEERIRALDFASHIVLHVMQDIVHFNTAFHPFLIDWFGFVDLAKAEQLSMYCVFSTFSCKSSMCLTN